MKKYVLALAALAEAGTGVILVAYPPIVVRLLFGAEISGVGSIMSRIAGIALIGLGVACWPGTSGLQPLNGMLTYSSLAVDEFVYEKDVAQTFPICQPARVLLHQNRRRRAALRAQLNRFATSR